MKSVNGLIRTRTQSILTLILLLLSISIQIHGQINHKDIVIFLTCVEDLGNGQHLAYFGYENPNAYVVNVAKKDSYLQFNGKNNKTFVLNEFQSGLYERAFSTAFDSDGQVLWHVRTNTYNDLEVVANSSSELCPVLNIIPYYDPPEGGKEFDSKIGAELTSLYETYSYDPEGFTGISDDIYQLDGTKVFIEVVAEDNQYSGMISALNGLGFVLDIDDPDLNRATGWLEIGNLLLLNEMIPLNYARPVFTGINDIIHGQGDVAMRTDYTRMGFYGMGIDPEDPFYLDGSGVRIGVISNSYNTKRTAHIDVEQDDLPGATNELGYNKEVEVLKDIITPEGLPLSDEGRAMMQIVHDVAPGAELVFRTGYLGELDMAVGIRNLADPDDLVTGNCDIIVDDITYITEPFFRDGIISQAINDVVDNNSVSYFSSAGNFSNYSYQDVFQAGSPLPGIAEEPHNFGDETTEDVLQLISLDAGTYTLVLQWDDGSDPDQAVTNTDLDIFLTHDDGTTLFGFNRDNTGEAPVEVLPFTVLEDGVFTNILINKADGPDIENLVFKYVVFRGGAGFHFEEDGHDAGSSTIVGHANAEGTMAVGAVRYHHTPAYGEAIVVEEFSSWGGTPIMTHSLVNPDSEPIERIKPDFTAPDGVNTSIELFSEGSSDYVHATDTDALPNFFGTSAAAPHAAGAAALIIHARRSFDYGNNTAPDDIRNLMRNTAIGITGHDPVAGHGFIQPYAAIRTFANPKPEIDEIIYPGGVTPGETQEPLTFTLKGNFYINEENPDEHTEIHFRGEELTSNVEIIDEQTIVVTHSFLGNPAIQAVNPPSPDGGPVEDGGTSEPIYFSDTPAIPIVIAAEDFTKKYGENLPDFSTVILPDEANPDAFYNTTINFDQFAPGEKERILERLSFDVKATATSVAGVPYVIDLDFAAPDPAVELDLAIAEKYDIEIEQGYLTVHKLALEITPKPATIIYGHELTQDNIAFDYVVDSDNIDQSILDDLDVQYNNPLPIGVPMVNGISLVRGTALVNVPEGNPVEVEVVEENNVWNIYIDDILYNGQALPRGLALVNDVPFVQIKEIIDGAGMFNGIEVSFEKIEGVSYITALGDDPPLEEPIAVENGIALVRGTALVNGVEVEVEEDGTLLVNGVVVRGTALVNGIPVVRGTALVNSKNIVRGVALVNQFVRGTALVNEIEVPLEVGIPDVSVNGFNPRGIALVNGIPIVRGTALVNGLNVLVDENGAIDVTGGEEPFAFVNGIALVRGTALVNGGALVRGVALVNDAPTADILDNMNFLASTNSLEYMPFVNGSPLVNGMEGVEGQQVTVATDPINNSFTSVRGIALVNGLALVRGTALVNGLPVVRGTALVNEETISDVSNQGAIVINHDAEESSSYIPVTFITGTDVGTHSIIPGTFLSTNFDISYGLGELTIEEAELTITVAENQNKTYGQSDPELLLGSYVLDGVPNDQGFDGSVGDVDLYGTDALSGSLERDAGEGVGSYAINLGDLTAGPNYNLTFVPGTFTINQAPITIQANNLGKIYGETDPPLTYSITVGSLVSGDAWSGALLRDEGEDVGTYDIMQGDLTAGPNYNLTFLPGVFTISQAPITIQANNLGKIYGGTDPPLTYSITVGSLVSGDAWSGALLRDEGENVRTYTIGQGDLSAGANYDLTFLPGVFTISQASLIIWPGINGKDYGDADPPSVIDRYELDGVPNSPEFDGTIGDVDLYFSDVLTGSLSRETGEDVGSYEINGTGNLSAGANYNISLNLIDQPRFYINPYGPGTRAIKPELNCVERLPSGMYIANLEYRNGNDAAVYIPAGSENNLLIGTGIFWELSDPVPSLFEPEGGAFQIYFDGTELSWVVNSLDEDHKVSSAANANASSTKCKKTKSAQLSGAAQEEELDPDQILVYPNPVTDKVHITMKDIEHYKMIELFDMTGRVHPITSIDKRTDNLEIDMAQLSSGYYFIKIIMDSSTEIVKLIKE